jgi:protein ImuA
MEPTYRVSPAMIFSTLSYIAPANDSVALPPPARVPGRPHWLGSDLAETIRRLENGVSTGQSSPATLPVGVNAIDRRLGGGLPTRCLHEIAGDSASAAGFAATLLAYFARARGTVAWIAARPGLTYAPGLLALGLAPENLLLVETASRVMRLWALAECLRLPGLAAVLAECDGVDFTASRKLQLAAATSGVTALLLDRDADPQHTLAARTRWRIAVAPSCAGTAACVGPPRWRVTLARGPGATSGEWLLERRHDSLVLAADATTACAVAAASPDRSARAQRG